MSNYVLERSQLISRSRAETFAFFSDAFNLERITPAFLKFRVLTPPPISLREGTLIDYQLSLFAVPFRWRTLIEEWKPEERFTDVQIKGPYALWRHTHTFEAAGPHQTLIRDRVEYRLPLGVIGRLVHALQIRRTLEAIFDYRAAVTARMLEARPESIA
jgi:hypothetical protein